MDLIRQSVGLTGRLIILVARPLPTQNNTNTEEKRKDIHASSGIRTHDPIVGAGEDISRLRPRGDCSRQNIQLEEEAETFSEGVVAEKEPGIV
jgi:hypothetical protein